MQSFYMTDLIQELIDDLNDNIEEIKHADHPHDYVYELVDSHVPIMHNDLLNYALHNHYIATSTPDIFTFDGSHSPVNAIAGNIYQELSETAHDWLSKHEL